ncbi:activin receptor type-2B-like protein [Dinothrombium tinctorium]|uniref:Serine/threonine-protein kinase receptor n=1 Tax=Dinothrombium tinctorium TaxID=1965070 RepID=A0A3S3QBB3_9ACAR|nr:activin receptor type-2B-like protein [Dinothrombium tinctorium]
MKTERSDSKRYENNERDAYKARSDTKLPQTRRCAFFNATLCSGNDCKQEEECKAGDYSSDKMTLCYALWQNDTQLTIKLKGCWVGPISDCFHQTRCVEKRKDPAAKLFYCCCAGDMCNEQQFHVPEIPVTTTNITPSTQPTATSPPYSVSIIVFTLLPLLLLTLLLIVAYWFYRYRKMAHFNEVPTREECLSICEYQKPFVPIKPIQLIEVKAKGRFGAVWKARIGDSNKEEDQLVAVKIFPRQDKNSWATEVEVYQLTKMRHENILTYLGAEERENMLPYNAEYWLITEYHENGSLSDYLKSHLVTYLQLLKISEGIARGLTFLHEEICANKPAIAHRDFKSKNVLLREDLTPCIGDFGLALIFYPGRSFCDTLGQVGTRRYMAPEVLEGAINFSRDSLLRIDMYALGLVLWELLSRCSNQDGPVGNYMLPFEEEVGPHPSLEDMQEVVCQQKKRPEIKKSWKETIHLRLIVDTIEECWDQDAEARLTASCVEERISCHRSYTFS